MPPQAAPAPVRAVHGDDDPDLTQAVEQIVEDDLSFTDEELGITATSVSPRVERPREPQAPAAPVAAQPPADEPAPVEEAADEDILDFSDFELDMDEEVLPSDAPAEAADDLSLDFEDTGIEAPADADDGLDLDLESDEEELDFSDLELELGGGSDELAATDVVGSTVDREEIGSADTMVVDDAELDFSDLDLVEDAEAEDLDLSLDEVSEQTETLMSDDELDFSDLERELDGTLDSADDQPADVGDLDLDLDLDQAEDEPETVLMGDDDLDFSEFELDLEEDQEPGPTEEKSVEAAAEEELDFSDLAGVLESDEPIPDLPDRDEDIDLELDFDDDEAPAAKAKGQAQEEEELDFSDLEDLLDDLDEGADHGAQAPDDLKLELDEAMDEDLDFEPVKTKAAAPADDDLDFSDVEAMLGTDDQDEDLDLDLGTKKPVSGFDEDEADLELALDDDDDSDIELELDLGEDEAAEMDETDDDEAASEMPAAADKASKAAKADAGKKDKKAPKRKAKGGGGLIVKLVVTLIVVLLLALGVYLSREKIEDMTGFAVPAVAPLEGLRDSIGAMGIPGISDWVKPAPKDPQGKLFLKTSGITGKIIVSPTLGDLFVITGKVQNNYQGTRNSISLVGKLFGEGGKVAQSKLFYAGNVIPEEELITMDEEIIKKRLQNRLGDNGVNAKVRPGQIVPFMVVFTNFSQNLTEFSVETGGSFQGAAIQ
ncbi:DUF3426 domain-containing protein [Desulfatiferula olefinivorans]